MEAQAYYSSMTVPEGDIEDNASYLSANCAGVAVLRQYFVTSNPSGRRDYYLQYLLEGEMTVTVNGREETMREGDVITYFPHTPYRYAMQGTKPIKYYWLHFSGTGCTELMRNCGIMNQKITQIGVDHQVILHFERLFHDYITREKLFALSACEKILSIYLQIAKVLSAVDMPQTDAVRRLDAVIGFIHKNYGKPLSVKELAARLYVSDGRFRVLFKARTGYTPNEYIQSLRLAHARQLLLQSDLSMKEIAHAVGYDDPLYFSRIFKSRVKLTPGEFRGQTNPKI